MLGLNGPSRLIIDMKSLFDVTLQSVTFTKMSLNHAISIQDYKCTDQLR